MNSVYGGLESSGVVGPVAVPVPKPPTLFPCHPPVPGEMPPRCCGITGAPRPLRASVVLPPRLAVPSPLLLSLPGEQLALGAHGWDPGDPQVMLGDWPHRFGEVACPPGAWCPLASCLCCGLACQGLAPPRGAGRGLGAVLTGGQLGAPEPPPCLHAQMPG